MRSVFLAATLLMAVPPLYAADATARTYLGFNLATPGEASFEINGRQVPNQNKPRAVKLYAGLEFTPTWAAELGYGAFGSWQAADPTPGSSDRVRLSSKLAYAAARATQPIGASVALFGKAGLAVNSLNMHDSAGHADRATFIRPMVGAGVAWTLSTQFSVTAEYARYGSRGSGSERFTQQKAEVGVAFRF